MTTYHHAISHPSYEIETRVLRAINKTINKFREHPYYFFTESDIITYLCQSVYTSRLEVERHNRRIYLVHREYPTNFRYEKDRLLTMDTPYPLSARQGARGNFDLAVLNPEFVENASIEDIVNKNVRDLEARFDQTSEELLVAVECKYIINSSRTFVDEVRKDNKKLLFAKQYGARQVINLVFCNTNPLYLSDFREAVCAAQPGVTAVFVQSYYDDKRGKKISPKPIVKRNNGDMESKLPDLFDMLPVGGDPFE